MATVRSEQSIGCFAKKLIPNSSKTDKPPATKESLSVRSSANSTSQTCFKASPFPAEAEESETDSREGRVYLDIPLLQPLTHNSDVLLP